MNSISKILVALMILLSFTTAHAQIKNAKIDTVKIYGNCGMCEKTIEKAGTVKKVAAVDWNKDTKMATLTYDAKKTNPDEILKRIALAGYDSDQYLAPDKAYNDLAACCQYDRLAKVAVHEVKSEMTSTANHSNHENHSTIAAMTDQKDKQLQPVFDHYFTLKDALVRTDGTAAAVQSSALLASINAVQMDKLDSNVHMVWMKVEAALKQDAANIAGTKDPSSQRNHFITLSKNMYALIKVSKTETPVFYQFCPMANGGKGANWLSKESDVKNPYYGSQMLSCGKTVETIK